MNLGDSRTVMCNVEGGEISAMELTIDHKPYKQGEKERIEKAGGEVMPKEGTTGPLRVWKKDEESPGLAVTRTLGDLLGMISNIINSVQGTKLESLMSQTSNTGNS